MAVLRHLRKRFLKMEKDIRVIQDDIGETDVDEKRNVMERLHFLERAVDLRIEADNTLRIEADNALREGL